MHWPTCQNPTYTRENSSKILSPALLWISLLTIILVVCYCSLMKATLSTNQELGNTSNWAGFVMRNERAPKYDTLGQIVL